MIFGIGTDIVEIGRMKEFWDRHGERGLNKILPPDEIAGCLISAAPAAFLAKRFAAKEALGNALGTGIRAPLTLPSISIDHDSSGKPLLRLVGDAKSFFQARGLKAHLSLSDEREFAVAFVVVESE